ncbi:MAG TPA: hypothetical protein VFW75_15225 [Acetobacteraceae bacterium]|nr:hypothetical protein [Acetobacteraceae bacterium]
MTEHLAASAALFFKPAPAGPELLAQVNIIPGLLAEYVSYYRHEDVLVRSSIGRERELAGRALRVHDLMDVRSFRRSEFYNDFLRRHAIADALLSVIADPAMPSGPLPILGFYRPPDAPLFSGADARQMQVWLPHVQRALRLRASIARQAQDIPAWSGSLLDQLSVGILITDGRHRVIYANRAARPIIDRRDGLCLSAGKLTSPLAATARAIAAALSAAVSSIPVGRDLRAPRQSGAEWLVSICPLSYPPPPPAAARPRGLGCTSPIRWLRRPSYRVGSQHCLACPQPSAGSPPHCLSGCPPRTSPRRFKFRSPRYAPRCKPFSAGSASGVKRNSSICCVVSHYCRARTVPQGVISSDDVGLSCGRYLVTAVKWKSMAWNANLHQLSGRQRQQ